MITRGQSVRQKKQTMYLGGCIRTANDYALFGTANTQNEEAVYQRQFLLAVERGDMGTVRSLLELNSKEDSTKFNKNCTDHLGRNALLMCIEYDNCEMIELLLSYGLEIGDSLLHAISQENVRAVEIIFQNQAQKKKNLHGFLGTNLSSSFTPDITPLILAAHRNNYEIIKLLLERGERLPAPHDVRCNCSACQTNSREDSLRHSLSRINAYQALASPSLICLSSKDPILTAFELSWEMKRLSRLENEFKTEYEKLMENCREFDTELLDQTRGSKELEMILNRDTESMDENFSETANLARLKLAIRYKQKKFVVHPNVQQLLASIWYEGLPGFRRMAIAKQIFIVFLLAIGFPILCITYIFAMKSKVGLLIRKPFIKFICHCSSYIWFLFLLFMFSQRLDTPITRIFQNSMKMESNATITVPKNSAIAIQGKAPSILEFLIVVWVAGFIWDDIKTLSLHGIRSYLNDMWNLIDFITHSLYLVTIALRGISFFKARQYEQQNICYGYFDRSKWDPYDPYLVSENFFAIANIFSQLKLIQIFTVNPHLGPLQISLGRMTVDIMKFAAIFLMVYVAFASGINQLYWYYAKARVDECRESFPGSLYSPIEMEKVQVCEKKARSYYGLFEILQTLYWAIFGLIDLEKNNLREGHHLTELIGKLMMGSYTLITMLVLVNMLIAMMSSSYQEIATEGDTEWKFARSKLWLSYFEDGRTIPSPFNLIPTPKSLYNLMRFIKDTFFFGSQKKKNVTWKNLQRAFRKIAEYDARYKSVMQDLIKRYIMHQQQAGQTEGVTEDDLNEIKQDISTFRYELLEILERNGMKVPDRKNDIQSRLGKARRRSYSMSVEKSDDTKEMSIIEDDETSSLIGQELFAKGSSVRKIQRRRSEGFTDSEINLVDSILEKSGTSRKLFTKAHSEGSRRNTLTEIKEEKTIEIENDEVKKLNHARRNSIPILAKCTADSFQQILTSAKRENSNTCGDDDYAKAVENNEIQQSNDPKVNDEMCTTTKEPLDKLQSVSMSEDLKIDHRGDTIQKNTTEESFESTESQELPLCNQMAAIETYSSLQMETKTYDETPKTKNERCFGNTQINEQIMGNVPEYINDAFIRDDETEVGNDDEDDDENIEMYTKF